MGKAFCEHGLHMSMRCLRCDLEYYHEKRQELKDDSKKSKKRKDKEVKKDG